MEGAQRNLRSTATARGASRDFAQLRALASFLAPYRWRVVGALVALVLAAGAVLSIGFGLRYVVDGGFVAGRPTAMNHGLEAVLIVVAILALATYTRSYLVAWLGERVVADIRARLYAQVVGLEPGFFEVTRTGEVISRIVTDTSVIQATISASISQALRNLLLLVGGAVLLVITNPRLTGFVLLVVPLVVVPIVLIGRQVRRLSRRTQDRVADVSGRAEETIAAVRTVQAFAQEERESASFRAACEEAFQAAAGYARARGLLAAVVIGLVFSAIVSVLWIGGHDVVAGRLTAGELASFVFYASVVAGAVGGLADTAGDLQRAAGAAERILELLAREPRITAPASPRPVPQRFRGHIKFESVTFAYPSRADQPILEGLDLEIRPGETVALVGPSGAGKTSVFQLLMRFYDPQLGRILIDGVDIREFDPRALRQRIGLVPQEPVIFSADARANVRYARPEADERAVLAAADAAAAGQFLRALPKGLDTFLGEKGVRLSGGQRQRVAIARAILADPSIFLLDEATSALDAESERAVQDALQQLRRGRTCLVIAHRLATVRNADRILVLDEGRLIAAGAHDELVTEGGLYARLAALQFDLVDRAA